MKKILWILSIAICESIGLEVRPDSIESSWTAGDSIWVKNNSPFSISIKSIYLKKVSGNIGDGLIFKVSNDTRNINGGFTHWYHLGNIGDSLYIHPDSWKQNQTIRIPPIDSISIKSIIYGTCIFCVSNSQPYNYHVEIHLVTDRNESSKIDLFGNFVSGKVHVWKNQTKVVGYKPEFMVNGRRKASNKNAATGAAAAGIRIP